MNNSNYELITARIIERLDKGIIPWRKEWTGTERPTNGISKKAYKGFNYFMLSSMGYQSELWYTFNQIKGKGGSVKKGEKSTPIIYFNLFDKVIEKDGKLETKSLPILRYYNVFNIEQTTLEQPKKEIFNNKPISEAEKIAKKCPVQIKYENQRAYYSQSFDTINMPKFDSFKTAQGYYSTLFHEMTHATGHKSRLNRDMTGGMQSETYSKEELIAEMGSAFLCHEAGISKDTIDNATAYIQGWIRALKNDPKMLVQASARAEKASDYILQLDK